MPFSELLAVIPEQPVVSGVLVTIVLVLLLYLARLPVHQALTALGHVLRATFRVAAVSVMRACQRLAQRNQEVLLATGEQAAERGLDREFRRIEATAKQSLEGYPALQRRISEQITLIDEDYRNAVEVPPAVPGWVEAITAISKVKVKAEPGVAEVLESIQGSFEEAAERAVNEYRSGSKQRHRLLKRMLPHWRRLGSSLDDVEKSMAGILKRAHDIDHQLDQYAEVKMGSERAVRTLSSSSFTQFFISTFVLLIAFGGAVVNFNLIAYPMQEMVGGTSYIGSFRTADVAGMVIILLEMAMGLFLMESLRITRLFPVINSLDDRMRVRLIWVSFTLLLILAGVEASLAYMRDLMAADAEALRQSLAAEAVASSMDNRWIPTIGQMTMGFILPFALTFVAIPLESFIHSSRTVVGQLGVAILRFIAGLLRVLGTLASTGARMLIRLYDLLIFVPLWFEARWQSRREEEPVVRHRPELPDRQGDITHVIEGGV